MLAVHCHSNCIIILTFLAAAVCGQIQERDIVLSVRGFVSVIVKLMTVLHGYLVYMVIPAMVILIHAGQ